MYVVSKSSHLILFFMVRETSTLSSVTALLKFHRQPQWRWISFCPHPLHNLLFVAFLTKAILTGVRLYLMVLWTSVSQTVGDIDSFSWDLFRTVWSKLACWNWPLGGLPPLPSFPLTSLVNAECTSRTFASGSRAGNQKAPACPQASGWCFSAAASLLPCFGLSSTYTLTWSLWGPLLLWGGHSVLSSLSCGIQ